MDLAPGRRIVLARAPDAPVTLRCGFNALFEGRVGRRKNNVAVCIDRALPRGAIGDR
jgi:flagellar motor switch protein FliM